MSDKIEIFYGLTRPSYFFGVVQEAFIVEIYVTTMIFLATNNIFMFGLLIPFHIVNMAICKIDNKAYRHLLLFCKTKLANRNFAKLKSSYYG